ncbi:hypothetical protein GGI12_000835 [Dipsacomyces acuminosporus]|nr:hypothetical protein GGI12_000835 [Dipsacomyces acuminosporus]
MPLAAPYPTLRLRAEPVAELSGFVASSVCAKTMSRLSKLQPSSPTTQSSVAFIHHKEQPDSSKRDQHERVLELLRTALASANLISTTTDITTVASDNAECSTPVQQRPSLEQHRAILAALLRDMQNPQAEAIVAVNSLLSNRTKLGLLDPASVREYCYAAQSSDSPDEEGTVAYPIGPSSHLCAGESNLSSSFNSDDTAATLASSEEECAEARAAASHIGPPEEGEEGPVGFETPLQQHASRSIKSSFIEGWASSGFWRGVSARSWSSVDSSSGRRRTSVSSERTAVALGDAPLSTEASADAPVALPDVLGICWPLDDAAKEAANSWGRFYAELGDVRVPTRFRSPLNSLAMLATEQLMMRNDKIVCPLKNRLLEANPRRQRFEDYIRTTGSIPPPGYAGELPASSLRNEV